MKPMYVLCALLLCVAFMSAEFLDDCDNGRKISRACCNTPIVPGNVIPVDEIDSILLMPGTCAIPPFCQSALPYADVFHEQADTYCAPHAEEYDTARIEFIICKNIDRVFVCYGRAANTSHRIDFGATSPTPCMIDSDGMVRADAACRVNVRLYATDEIHSPIHLSSTRPLTFRPILQPALAPFRGVGATRVLLKRDTAWLGDLSDSTLFVDALLPECVSKAEFIALKEQVQTNNFSINFIGAGGVLFVFILLGLIMKTDINLTDKIQEMYIKARFPDA